MGIESYSTTAATNATATGGSVNMAEGMAPSGVNNSTRQIMADIRALENDRPWFQYGSGDQGSGHIATPCVYASATTFTIAGTDVTSAFHPGRRVRAVGTSTGTIYGRVVKSAFSTNTTVTMKWDGSGALSSETLTISLSQSAMVGDPSGMSNAFVNLLSYGAVGDDSTDNATAISNALSDLASAGGGTLWIPPGTYRDSGTRTLAPKINMVGSAMGFSILKHTATSGVQFNMPNADETTINYGGNYIHNITFQGTWTILNANTVSAFKIKNKTNIRFDHCEMTGYQYHVQGVRDASGNSVNNISFTGVRFGLCQTAIYAACQWNGLYVDRTCQFFLFDDWAIIAYDCDGITINGVFNASPTTSGAGHVFLGGCSGIDIGGTYFEGNPSANHFLNITSAKDRSGSATNNAIAISTSRGGAITGIRASSGSGTAYVVKLDGVQCIGALGCRAGSGISTAFAYLTTGTRGNSFFSCYPASGAVVAFQSAADNGYNVWQQYNTGELTRQLPNYTVSTLPNTTAPGQDIFVSNEAGGEVPGYSSGARWGRDTDRVTVS